MAVTSASTWETLAPRLGLTYALGESRQTLLRASYSRFADQLGTANSIATNPLYASTYVYFYYDDKNHNGKADPSEVITQGGPLFVSGNWDPRNGGLLVSNQFDPDFSAPITDELLLGVEHALRPEFVLGLNLTYRKYTNLVETERLVFDGDAYSASNLDKRGRVHTANDYRTKVVTATLPSGEKRSVTVYELKPGITTRNGFDDTNGDREQEYLGASLTFNKRLSIRWMLRGNVSWQDWSWNVPNSESRTPPRSSASATTATPCFRARAPAPAPRAAST